MFLMNTSALVALQRKWEPFSQPKNYRYPVCFSESEDDLPRSAVSTKVQVIINNLQSEDSSLHSGSEYGCLVPKKPKAEKVQSQNVRRSGRVLQKRDCPANSDDMEVEERSGFEALLLPSDSDDSVDRDIEEAIQEFLKNKGQNVPPLRGGVDGNGVVPDSLGDGTDQWVASPCSVSSDDSFEQSIEAEIEQFLNEKKKQQSRKETTAEEKKRLDQKETQEKWVVRGQRDSTDRVSQSSLKQGDKAFFLRQDSHLQNISTQCLKPKTEELAGFKTRQTPLASHSLFLEQSREGEKGQKLWKTGGEQSDDVSDSSSDDGIEEAIQLYQLEKIRRASESRTARAPFQTEEDISSRLLIRSVNALSSERRKLAAKPEELSRIREHSIGLDSRRNRAPAACALTLQASCRADTTAELMCAEAILDISKTILPPPGGSNPFFCSRDGSASQRESDSNSVDSDDSIEQEIRAFLAVKAQTESLITKSCTQHLKQIPRKPFKLSLSHPRKLKGENKIVREPLDVQRTLLEQNNNHSRIKKDGGDLSILQNTQKAERCYPDTLDTGTSADPPQQGCETKLVQNPPKCGLDDKSSSLDSDEDLDTAIKELLRSKRKLKKKPKDPRAPCRKKVRFDETATRILGGEERDCKSQKPAALKSCLVSSQRDVRVENAASRNYVKGKPKGTKVMQFKKDVRATSKNNIWTATSLTEESSSVDSDDSIEQEIQRFLAEKSKSIVSMDTPASNGIVGCLGAHKSQAAEAKYQQFQGQSHAISKQRGKMKKLGPPTIEMRPEGETTGNGERIITSYAVNSEGIQQIAASTHPGLPVKRIIEGSQMVCRSKLDQRSLPSKAENSQPQNRFEPLSLFQCRNSYKFKISSNFISGLKNNKRPTLWGRNQSTDLPLFKRQGVVPIANLPGESCAMTPKWGSKSGKVADLSTRNTAKGWHIYVADHDETSLNNVTKIKFWGDQEACGSLDADQRSHLQEPKRQNMLKASTGLLCSEEKEGHNIHLNQGKDTSSTYDLTLRGKSSIAREEQPPKVIKVESL